jgi:hypothetical protein
MDSVRRGKGNPRVRRALSRDSLRRSRIVRAANLSSSMIKRVCYDEEESSLSIWFRESGRYVYSDVPRAIYEGLRKAPSAGRYFNDRIKRRYPCRPDPERRRFTPQFGG